MPLELNYHHLFYFWRCVRAGRITAAAQDLHLSQSALSLQLQSLERALGKRLLTRSRRGVELTVDGRLVYDHCERIFAAGEALGAALRGSKAETMTLRLGVTAGLGRETVLATLSALGERPDTVTSIYVGPREDVRERLARRRLDLAIAGADFSPGLGVPFRSTLVDTRPLVFAAAPALAARWRFFPVKGEVPMLLRTRENPLRAQVLGWLRERGCRPLAVAETEDLDLLRELAVRGRGVVAVNQHALAGDIAAGRLKVLARSDIAHEVWVNWYDDGADPAVRRLLSNLPALRARLRS